MTIICVKIVCNSDDYCEAYISAEGLPPSVIYADSSIECGNAKLLSATFVRHDESCVRNGYVTAHAEGVLEQSGKQITFKTENTRVSHNVNAEHFYVGDIERFWTKNHTNGS